MFILSQDEDKLVSLENIEISDPFVIKGKIILGSYMKEGRCKKVFMEIVNQLENIESYEQRYEFGGVTKVEKSQVVFKMPKE